MYRFFCLLSIFLATSTSLFAEDSAVILLYHNVSETTPSITSVTPVQFAQHLEYLRANEFSILPISSILESIESGDPLPERAIAISFDDGYESIYDEAFPLLRSYDWPFSIFVSSDANDMNYGGYLSWDSSLKCRKYGAEIGGHSQSHDHLVRILEGESQSEWMDRVTREIDQGNRRIEEELGVQVQIFAYPYGEFNDEIGVLIASRDLFGLAQQSGAVGALTNLGQIPRFPMLGGYADLERLELVVNTKPLPVTEFDGGEMIRVEGDPSGEFRFQLEQGDYRVEQIACYSSAGERLKHAVINKWVIVQLPIFQSGRNKINCTAPSASESGVYYWYSHQWLVKTSDGIWPPE